MRNNPAQRLHDLLTALKAVPPTVTVRDAWAGVIGVAPTDTVDFLSAVGDVAELPGQIEALLIRVVDPADLDVYLEWTPAVAAVITGFDALRDPVEGVLRQYDNATLTSLRHASLRLQGDRGIVSDQVLAELLEQLDELDQALASADLDPILQLYLQDLLTEMRRACRLARVTGTEGLQTAIDRAIGGLLLRYQTETAATAPTRTMMQRIGRFFTNAAVAIAAANGGYELGGNIAQAIAAIGS